jgi:hypothetical protein
MKNTGRSILVLIPIGMIMSVPLTPGDSQTINSLPVAILGAVLLLTAVWARVSNSKLQ